MKQNISENELVEKIKSLKGATPATVVLETHPSLPKSSPFYGKVTKHTCFNGFLNTNYEAAVNRQLEREGIDETFVASDRVWGQNITSSLIEHKDNYYVQFKVEKKLGDSSYFYEGDRLDKDTISALFPKAYSHGKQEELGLDHKVMIRTPKISSIRSINFAGEEYEVIKSK